MVDINLCILVTVSEFGGMLVTDFDVIAIRFEGQIRRYGNHRFIANTVLTFEDTIMNYTRMDLLYCVY